MPAPPDPVPTPPPTPAPVPAPTVILTPVPHRSVLRHVVAAFMLMAAFGGLGWIWFHSHWRVTTDNAYVVGNITPVSAEVGGTIVAMYTDDNMLVAAGDPIAQIDPVPYQYKVDQAQADLRQARADAAAARVNVDLVREDRLKLLVGAKAKHEEAAQALRAAAVDVTIRQRIHQKEEEVLAAVMARVPGVAALAKNAADYRTRFNRLAETGAISVQDRDNRDAADRDAQAKLDAIKNEVAAAERQVLASEQQVQEARVRHEQAQRALAAAEAAVGQAEAAQLQPDIATSNSQAASDRVALAEAKFRQAQLALSNCLIRAPQAGIVSRRTLQLGQTVTPRAPFLSIVPLDTDNVWVVANFTEDQMTRVRVGDRVRVAVDAIPDRTYIGWVESVSGGTGTVFSVFPADNATGNFTRVVQRLPVRIRFDGPDNYDIRVRPGLSTQVWVDEGMMVRKGRDIW
ncbi:MAG: HlyD family secretion protein [Bacteroidales bacterium]|nr:HlyD family secretion protein [Bacteroidales bacterium]